MKTLTQLLEDAMIERPVFNAAENLLK